MKTILHTFLLFLGFLGLFSFQAESAQQKFSFNYSYQSTQTEPTLSQNQSSVAAQTQSVAYQLSGIRGKLDLSWKLDLLRPDYDQTQVRDMTGQLSLLGQTRGNRPEAIFEQKTSLGLGPTTIQTTLSSHLTDSPYFQSRAELGFLHLVTGTSTQGKLFLGAIRRNQPEDHYLDLAFFPQPRPRVVHIPYVRLGLEQPITSWWKTSVDGTFSQRYEERPVNFGVTLKNAFALHSRIFTQIWISQIAENKNQPLRNERGYFRLRSAELFLTLEPVYDFLVSASYALVQEREWDPRTSIGQTVGSDQFGLGIQYAFSQWEVLVKGAYRLNNTRTSELLMTGGITWQL